jgi:hypothetical protein
MKHIFKHIFHLQSRRYVLYILSIFILFVSCKKSFTELNPLDSLSETTAFSDPSKIELVANGMYWQAAVGIYDPGTGPVAGRGYPFGGASVEQGEMRGEDMVNLATFYAITYEATYNAASANNANHWEQLYQLINQANVLADGANKAGQAGILGADVAKQYEGEGKFMRALAHHELLVHFSRPYADNKGSNMGVPYRDVAINNPTAVAANASLGRGTVAEAYTKLLADLDWAEQNLPDKSPRGAARPSKGAAIALKTRIKLHMGDWAGVVAEGAKLGTDGAGPSFTSPVSGFILEADPETPFKNYTGSKESIFSIANSASSNGGVNGALPQMLSAASTAASPSAGRGLVAISPNFYNAPYWVTGDKRRNLLVQQATSPKIFFTNKYWDYTTRANWTPIIRYAEVLLNVAEAKARMGGAANLTGAFNLLNAVRNRSVPVADRFITAPVDLILAILRERRIELSAEGRRWADIQRLALDPVYGTNGIPAKILGSQIKSDGSDYNLTTRPMITPSKASIPYKDFRFVWPLSSREVTANPTLRAQQNPEY